ncbi:MAG: phosphoribosyltransferase family protein [Thermodesulfobacteriota bacterium]|nr:phosphoribosyltransferase family protein [Thermodesulfobacteriota bacterium]
MDRSNIIERPDLHNRTRVFRDRQEAGLALAQMMERFQGATAIVLAIPAGGVPVGAEIARQLGLPLDVAVVSKITLPWNTEAGYGALAFDDTLKLNDHLVARLGLKKEEIEEGIAQTRTKVERRVTLFRGDKPLPSLSDRTVILIDDGLASGFTMSVAVEALYKVSPSQVVVAVPTGHSQSVEGVAGKVDRMYCANIRTGFSFAVAEAYEYWYDVTEEEVLEELAQFQRTTY